MPGLGAADGTFVTLVLKMACGKMPVSPSNTNRLLTDVLQYRSLTTRITYNMTTKQYDDIYLKVS